MHYSNLWHLLILFSLSLPFVSALPVPTGQESLSSPEIQHGDPVYTPQLGPPCSTIYATPPSSTSYVDPAFEYARRSPAKPHVKLSAEAQRERKEAVRSKMENRQRYNQRGRDRQVARMSPEQRAARHERFKAHQEKLKVKAEEKQEAANDKRMSRLRAGKARMEPFVATYKETKNLPHRADIYTVTERVPGSGNTGETRKLHYTGANVRTAVFNHHFFSENPANIDSEKRIIKPKDFENRLQGPPGDKKKPIPEMHGTGTEFPISSSHGGYHGGQPGPARVIMQSTHSGHELMGVVAHDAARGHNGPGHNDHFLVTPQEHSPDWKENLGEGIVFHV